MGLVAWLPLAAATLVLAALLRYLLERRRKMALLPPLLPGPPILGDWSYVTPGSHKVLTEAAPELGGVVTAEVSGNFFVFVRSIDAMKELFVRQGAAVADRPRFEAGKAALGIHGEEGGLIQENGPIFREQRRFALSTLRDLGFGKPVIEQCINEEIETMLAEMKEHKERPFNARTHLANASANIICRVVFGRRFGREDPAFLRALDAQNQMARSIWATTLAVVPVWLSPLVPLVPAVKRQLREMVAGSKAFAKEVLRALDQCREERPKDASAEPPETFVEAFVRKQEAKSGEFFTEEQLEKGTGDLFLAGTDTSSTTLYWLLLHLLRHPELQEQAYAKITEVIGPERRASMADKDLLGFVEALLWETQRLTPLIPIFGRRANADLHYQGRTIPAGTKVFGNIYAVTRDPSVWPEPNNFDPTRFLDENGKLDVAKTELIAPFGMGKRRCLGEVLARAELLLIATAIIQTFRLELPAGQSAPRLEDQHTAVICCPHDFLLVAKPRN